jgi:hypothetical protein
MAIKTVWSVAFACGDTEDRDLSSKRADERAGYAAWLAKKQCTSCWRASQTETGDRLSDEAYKAKRRADEAAEVAAWEIKADMPPLTGAEKALEWGARTRHQMMTAAYDQLVMNGGLADDDWLAMIEEPARRLTSASWWIDNREVEATDVPELVQAATMTDAASSENPFA